MIRVWAVEALSTHAVCVVHGHLETVAKLTCSEYNVVPSKGFGLRFGYHLVQIQVLYWCYRLHSGC